MTEDENRETNQPILSGRSALPLMPPPRDVRIECELPTAARRRATAAAKEINIEKSKKYIGVKIDRVIVIFILLLIIMAAVGFLYSHLNTG